MNFALFLILLIALIIILISIILYNGLKIELFSKKEKSNFEIEFKASILNIAIFKRQYPSEEAETLETKEENSANDDNESSENPQKDKKLKEKFNEFKPLLKDLKNSKQELKEFLLSILKDIDFKELFETRAWRLCQDCKDNWMGLVIQCNRKYLRRAPASQRRRHIYRRGH